MKHSKEIEIERPEKVEVPELPESLPPEQDLWVRRINNWLSKLKKGQFFERERCKRSRGKSSVF